MFTLDYDVVSSSFFSSTAIQRIALVNMCVCLSAKDCGLTGLCCLKYPPGQERRDKKGDVMVQEWGCRVTGWVVAQ